MSNLSPLRRFRADKTSDPEKTEQKKNMTNKYPTTSLNKNTTSHLYVDVAQARLCLFGHVDGRVEAGHGGVQDGRLPADGAEGRVRPVHDHVRDVLEHLLPTFFGCCRRFVLLERTNKRVETGTGFGSLGNSGQFLPG